MLSTAPISAKVQILSPYNEEPYSLSNLHDVLLAMIPDVSQNYMDLVQTFRKAASGFR